MEHWFIAPVHQLGLRMKCKLHLLFCYLQVTDDLKSMFILTSPPNILPSDDFSVAIVLTQNELPLSVDKDQFHFQRKLPNEPPLTFG